MRSFFIIFSLIFFFNFPTLAQQPGYKFSSYDNTRGVYKKFGYLLNRTHEGPGEPYHDDYESKLRFINIAYSGPSNRAAWRQAFRDAIAYYQENDLNCKTGRDGDFFIIDPATQSRILGWVDDTTGFYGYLVVVEIKGDKVIYVTSDGRVSEQVGPGNFEYWPYTPLDLKVDPILERGFGKETHKASYRWALAAIQIWKHSDGATAGASFRLLEKYHIERLHTPKDPEHRISLHHNYKTQRSFEYEQLSVNEGGILNMYSVTGKRTLIHSGKYEATGSVGEKRFFIYRIHMTLPNAPQNIIDATNARRFEVWVPQDGFGRVQFMDGAREISEEVAPPTGMIVSQPSNYRSQFFQDETP